MDIEIIFLSLYIFVTKRLVYRVTHKEWNFNDHLKLLKYDDMKVEFGFFYLIKFLKSIILWSGNKCASAGYQGEKRLDEFLTVVSEISFLCVVCKPCILDESIIYEDISF